MGKKISLRLSLNVLIVPKMAYTKSYLRICHSSGASMLYLEMIGYYYYIALRLEKPKPKT